MAELNSESIYTSVKLIKGHSENKFISNKKNIKEGILNIFLLNDKFEKSHLKESLPIADSKIGLFATSDQLSWYFDGIVGFKIDDSTYSKEYPIIEKVRYIKSKGLNENYFKS